ncbi:hypothetical protein HK100_006961 [Physocladia obscura]|uniref:Uncharacterized protein n=1 Tax=Physocladia obscura TaxID=109957 RepID=A0AAD5SS98_9FUNG|nr:hypothetical protein HK100_006961 [Physocladia obscura]
MNCLPSPAPQLLPTTSTHKLSLAEEIRREALQELYAFDSAPETRADNQRSIAPAAEYASIPPFQLHFAQTRDDSSGTFKEQGLSMESYNVNASQRIDRILSLLKSAEAPMKSPDDVNFTTTRIEKNNMKSENVNAEENEYKPAIFDEVKAKLGAQQKDIDEKTQQIELLMHQVSELTEQNESHASE